MVGVSVESWITWTEPQMWKTLADLQKVKA